VAPGEVAGATTFNAKSGAATWNSTALTCGNVSCHGGQTTPNWQTGSINVNTQCTSCHTRGTTQYNSQNSGEHKKHETAKYNNVTVVCADCHNTTTLATNHFTSLGTTAMEGPASATIGGGTTRINAGNYSSTTGNCTPVCHQQEKW
jgi:predicted CxxxxCH...CXXCH cytochrome family protein